jgi:AAA+ superfamily predicted ATPase
MAGHQHGQPKGVASFTELPSEEGIQAWEHVFLPGELRDSLLRRTVFTMRNRGRLAGMRSAIQGMLLFVGPPGTGKSTTARALASRAAEVLASEGTSSLVRIDPHALPSSSLGESQQNVKDLLGPVIAEYSKRTDFVFVVIDEVESFAVRRSSASFETNPVDVHRATDAVLEGLDELLFRHPNILFLMTTNFPEAVDEAVLSRVDALVEFSLPDAAQIALILRDTLDAYAQVWPDIGRIRDDARALADIAARCSGLSGREVRKLVLAAIVRRDETVADPSTLVVEDFLAVV